MNYQEALSYIHSFEKFGWVLGLERITELLKRLGDPQKKLRFVHIAGTNGKGSTTVMCANILTHAGYRCGMFTSPYVIDFCERYQIDGEMISHQEFAELTSTVKPVIEQMKEENIFVTEFEAVTAIGFLYFFQHRCDIVCLEVGLGGSYDSTNVIEPPLACVITSISMDHVNILGNTIEKIAREKAGIIKKNCDCVCYPLQHPGAMAVLMEQCARTNSRFYCANPNHITITLSDLDGSDFLYEEKRYHVSLIGDFQVYNAVNVIETIRILRTKGYPVSEQDIRFGLENTVIPARFERLKKNPDVIVDGAHNLEGASALAHTLSKIPKPKTVIIGMLADKDYEHSLKAICGQADNVICVPVDNPRALDCEALCQYAQQFCKHAIFEHDLSAAYQKGLSLAQTDGLVLVCGSLYLAGDMIRMIQKNQ